MKPNSEIKKIIFGVFYYPPKARMKTQLLNHLNLTINILKLEHPTAQVIILGDRNEIQMKELDKIHPSLTQIVDQPTRKGEILDVILSDMPELFQSPMIIPQNLGFPVIMMESWLLRSNKAAVREYSKPNL